ARALAALSHPNIVAIHDFGVADGRCYAVMELLEGETLRARLRGGPLPWDEALAIALKIVDGLCAAHAKGIIHRDLKPDNIYLTADHGVRILDFGLAKREEDETEVDDGATMLLGARTEPGTIVGTVAYMSPEQARAEPLD